MRLEWVESSAALFCDDSGEVDGLKKQRADLDGFSWTCAKAHQFAGGIEAGAVGFDFVEPAKRPLKGLGRRLGRQYVQGHESVHRNLRADGQRRLRFLDYLALPSASTTAP